MQGQNIDDFVTELKSSAAHCEFQTLKDSLIEDKLLIGVNDKKVQERLLREEDLEKAMHSDLQSQISKTYSSRKFKL